MKSRKDRILVHRCSLLVVALLLLLSGPTAEVAQGRSLYAIGSITHWAPLPIFAYDIGADGLLTFQAEHGIPYEGGGAVGIAIDWQSEYLFITYESLNVIHVLDARTMANVGRASAPGAEDLAGIVFDESRGYLYCMDRGTDKLYAYKWNPGTGRLIPKTGSPFILEGSSAYGIALDEEHGLLYTANVSQTVPVYDTEDWSLVDTLTIGRSAISIAVDVANGLLYTGAGFLGDSSLNRYDLATGRNKSIQVDPTAGVMGLAVDWATGFIYVTTGLNNRPAGNDLLVYDPSMTLVDSILDIGNPTGIVIPARELGYNPLRFVKEIVTDPGTEDGEDIFVSVGETVSYRLCFENATTIRDVSIVDVLPEYVTFESADGDGDFGHYNPDDHTYSWWLESIPPGSRTCLYLQVKVKPQVPVGTRLRNHATIKTGTVPPATVSADATIRGGDIVPLGLSKQVISGVQREDGLAYANAGDLVSYAINYSNEDNDYPVTRVSIVDTLPETMTFVGAEGGPDGGAYDPVSHTYTCSYASLAPGATGRISLTAQIKSDTPVGTTITNSVILDCNEVDPTTATADIIIKETELQPLNLTKEIIAGGTDPNGDGTRYVNVGEEITYLLCFDNRDNDRAVDAISVVDYLPTQMTFVRAEGEGEIGHFDQDAHAYVWSIPSLAAGESVCLELVTQVNDGTRAGTVLLNRATIDSDQIEATTTDANVIVEPIDYRPLNLAKRISAGEIPGDDKTASYVGIGDEITYQICFDNNNNDYRIQELSVVDTLPAEVTFVSADGDGAYGYYDADKHAYTWAYPSLIPGFETCLDLVVQVRGDTAPGTTITNSVTIDSNDIAPQTARVSTVAQRAPLKPLGLTKTVTSGITGRDDAGTLYVGLGQEITYTICAANENNRALDNAIIVDSLPTEVTFVSADGDGEFGRYDRETHTYTWSYPTIEAGTQVCLDLTVRVNEDAGHGVTITNQVRTQADDVASTVETDVKTELEPPLLRKTVLSPASDGTVKGEAVSASPGEEVTYEICLESNQDVDLHNIVITDRLPAGVIFVSADGESGHYDPGSHTYTWTFPIVAPGTVICLKLTVRLEYDLQPSEVLQNTVTLDASESPPVDADVDIIIIDDTPMEGTLTVSPLILGRQGYNRSDQIKVVLELPNGVRESDVGSDLLHLDPGGITADSQAVSVNNGKVQILAYFNLAKLLEAIPVDGITTLYVGGNLLSGRSFFGQGNVLVVAVRPF